MPKYFSLDEANQVLQQIKPLIAEVMEIRQVILERGPQAWLAVQRAAGNGGSKEASEIAEEFERLDELVHRILDTGVQVKDLDTGLLDFLAIRDGREVLLCWKFGEDEIRFWHDLNAGFAGRQPL